MGFSNTEHEAIVGHYFGGVTLAAPTTPIRVHLHTGDPGATGADNEVSTAVWTNYAPPPATWTAVQTGAGDGERYVENDATVDFGEAATTDPVEVTHFTIKDDAGRYIAGDSLDAAQTVNDGNPVRFDAGDLSAGIERAA